MSGIREQTATEIAEQRTAPPSQWATILVAEDDPDDRAFIREVFHDVGAVDEVRFVSDGEELLDYLQHRGRYTHSDDAPRPHMILLDLKMPRKDGYEALSEIKVDTELRRIPVVVLSTSRDQHDVVKSYDLGAVSYINKPVSYGVFVQMIRKLSQYWFETVELPRS